jgi:hypothetical protein
MNKSHRNSIFDDEIVNQIQSHNDDNWSYRN